MKILTNITPEDFKILESLIKSEIARNWRNPTSYYSNLFRRALDIAAEHICEDAEPVESHRVYHGL